MKPIAQAFENLSPDVRAELLRPVQTYDPRNAEIVEGARPRWHLVEVYEPAQRDVQKVMIERRFGIFVPESEVVEVRRGRKVTQRSLIFPGYIFVFVWDIDRHWSRIAEIPGVSQIMASKPDMALLQLCGRTVDEIAVGIGVSRERAALLQRRAHFAARGRAIVVGDDLIDQIRAVENGECRLPAKKRTRGKRQQDDEVVATYSWSAFPDRLLDLDSEKRNQTLRKALGLS
ncbi:transcription termination/antitermination NusG family protein [Bradyrhizobium sp. SEMIA]|uniref:transcription termination/antitermination NusG family protein n=1 Tax=Bradyrhizobium sp. SEMIA TaxID=2597515 RepID=UPI0018A3A69F|nr:transcription termination/antitermination NusG family protein [Bradyrhizobium sp. SEMIA]QOG20442.1 hypothetical protein FOM02_26915 [Bradyrhizobium sp. SEMIA]